MTLSEEYISTDSFEVINSTKLTDFTDTKMENNCISNPIDDSPIGANGNTVADSNWQTRIIHEGM